MASIDAMHSKYTKHAIAFIFALPNKAIADEVCDATVDAM